LLQAKEGGKTEGVKGVILRGLEVMMGRKNGGDEKSFI